MSSKPIIHLKVLTPEGVTLEVSQLTSVIVPLIDGGTIGIKPDHGPLIAETQQGIVRYQSETGHHSIELHPGVLDIRDNLVLILTAGEISDTPEVLTEPEEMEFNRLIKTLGKAIIPSNVRELETIDDELEKRDR